MADITITYTGSTQLADRAGTAPCLTADRDGENLARAWVSLTHQADYRLRHELNKAQTADPDATIEQLLVLHGIRKLEQAIQDASDNNGLVPNMTFTWDVLNEDVPQLLQLLAHKVCSYRVGEGRDFFCTTPAPGDSKALYAIGNRRAAPTSLPLCTTCDLPSTDYLCSSFSHPEVSSVVVMQGMIGKRITGALCNDGQEVVLDSRNCRPSGHPCWKRVMTVGAVVASHAAPADLPDALDTLSAYWKLAFGKQYHLVSFHSLSGASELSLHCENREEFKSRLSALADIFDKLKIDENLLPDTTPDDRKIGSINRLETVLKVRLPVEDHKELLQAIGILRQTRRVRVALQHTGGNSTLASELAKLGIHDAPPNWRDAWDKIRALCADSVVAIRSLIGRWQDTITQ